MYKILLRFVFCTRRALSVAVVVRVNIKLYTKYIVGILYIIILKVVRVCNDTRVTDISLDLIKNKKEKM